MESFCLVLYCFLVSFTLHILVHRFCRAHVALMVAAYAAGAALLYGLILLGRVTLPWSSGFLFVLLSCTAIFFYLANSFGDEIPTSVILASFQRKKEQTVGDLTALFTDRRLIRDHTDDLVHSKLVMFRENRLKLTGRGKIVWRVMEIYRRVFHRTLPE